MRPASLRKNVVGGLRRMAEGLSENDKTCFPFPASTENAEAIQSLCYSELAYPSAKQSVVFRSYVRMVNLAYHAGCRRVLELGAGLSTALWLRFAENTEASVCSIDMDFEAGRSFTSVRWLIGKPEADTPARDRIELLEGATITSEDLLGFYSGEPIEEFAGSAVASFAEYLDSFRSPGIGPKRRRQLAAHSLGSRCSARDVVVQGESLVFARELVNIFSVGEDFDNELALLKRAESMDKGGLLDNLIARGDTWDMVFFDSGELSSMIEWVKVKDRITRDGLAAFHDIFFPKSMKNFVACAQVAASPDWKVVYIDCTGPGLMIAQRTQ